MMTDVPPELASFASLLDAQPAPVRDAFNYCLCLLMAQAGKMCLIEKLPSEGGTVCVFATTRGDRFSVARPAISKEQEAALIDVLRESLRSYSRELVKSLAWIVLFCIPMY